MAPKPASELDEAALVAGLKLRDPAAYRVAVRRWHGTFVWLAASIVGDRSQAEEVVQEAWIAVIDGIGRFEHRSSLSSWLTAIVLNRARNRARQLRRRAEVPLDGTLDRPAVDADRFAPDGHWRTPPGAWDVLDPERIVAGRTLWAHVATLIDVLPPGQRAVVVLRDVEGLDAEEACRLLDITPENQRVLLHRARARLRAGLESLLGGPPAL